MVCASISIGLEPPSFRDRFLYVVQKFLFDIHHKGVMHVTRAWQFKNKDLARNSSSKFSAPIAEKTFRIITFVIPSHFKENSKNVTKTIL